MGLLRRDTIDDVDVASCLANIHRLEAMGPLHVVDLTRSDAWPDVVAVPEPLADASTV